MKAKKELHSEAYELNDAALDKVIGGAGLADTIGDISNTGLSGQVGTGSQGTSSLAEAIGNVDGPSQKDPNLIDNVFGTDEGSTLPSGTAKLPDIVGNISHTGIHLPR